MNYTCLAIGTHDSDCLVPVEEPIVCPELITNVTCDPLLEDEIIMEHPDEPCCSIIGCICKPVVCPELNCTEYEHPVYNNFSIGCCDEEVCVCRPEEDLEMLCEEFTVGECDPGYSMVQSFANGTSDCCLHEECICDKCVIDELEFEIDDEVTMDYCEVYVCTDVGYECPEFVLVQNHTMECPSAENVTCDNPDQEYLANGVPEGECCPDYECTCKPFSELNCTLPACTDNEYIDLVIPVSNETCCPVFECFCYDNPDCYSCPYTMDETIIGQTEDGCCPIVHCSVRTEECVDELGMSYDWSYPSAIQDVYISNFNETDLIQMNNPWAHTGIHSKMRVMITLIFI